MTAKRTKKPYAPISSHTFDGIFTTDEALFDNDLEALRFEQEEDLKKDLSEYEAIVRAERLWR